MVDLRIARYGVYRNVCSDYLMMIALYALEARFGKDVKFAPGEDDSIIYVGTIEDQEAIQADIDNEILQEAKCSKEDFVYRRWLRSKTKGRVHPSMKLIMKAEVSVQELLSR